MAVVWKRYLLCRHVVQECQLLLRQSEQPRGPAASVRGKSIKMNTMRFTQVIRQIKLFPRRELTLWDYLIASFIAVIISTYYYADAGFIPTVVSVHCAKWGAAFLRLQVALGDCNELLDADYQANKLPGGKHSTKGLGQTGPDPRNSVTLLVFTSESQILYWSWGTWWKRMSTVERTRTCSHTSSALHWEHLRCVAAWILRHTFQRVGGWWAPRGATRLGYTANATR